jgi:hypothetical protein
MKTTRIMTVAVLIVPVSPSWMPGSPRFLEKVRHGLQAGPAAKATFEPRA